jgi:imidazoleglycerol phosphate dehydratase HisB
MLDAFAKHSAAAACKLVATGDGLDNHHLIEDVGIALGSAIYEALGEKRGIARFGSMPCRSTTRSCSAASISRAAATPIRGALRRSRTSAISRPR